MCPPHFITRYSRTLLSDLEQYRLNELAEGSTRPHRIRIHFLWWESIQLYLLTLPSYLGLVDTGRNGAGLSDPRENDGMPRRTRGNGGKKALHLPDVKLQILFCRHVSSARGRPGVYESWPFVPIFHYFLLQPSQLMSFFTLSFHLCVGLPLFIFPATGKSVASTHSSLLLLSRRGHTSESGHHVIFYSLDSFWPSNLLVCVMFIRQIYRIRAQFPQRYD